ncbi:MAG: hypothetical protein KDA41_16470 [Planctomycetales bacterium]|nr:hypothetical protein [Planctomycetales bacterium]
MTTPPTVGKPAALTEKEIEAVLAHVSHGMSLRQAAAEIGRSHSTLVKLAKRNELFAEFLEEQRQKARGRPLAQVYAASQRSWRAAAWLVKYLDGRERQGRGRNAG